ADTQEVDMQREVLDGVKLIVLRQDLDLLAADVDRGDRGQEPAAVDLVENVLVGQGDSQGGLFVAVNDCRHFTVAANCTGGPLTDLFARFGIELVRIVAHGFSFRVYWSISWAPPQRTPKMSKAAESAALIRVASKGVYAGGGPIAEGGK